MEKITLETLYTPYTLDTYSIFDMDIDEMSMFELEGEYDDYTFEYDFDTYKKDLAVNMIKLLKENIIDNVITGIESDCVVHSPKEYNYTTDKIYIDFIVNKKELDLYIEKNIDKYNTEKIKDREGFWWLGNEDQTRLNFYLCNKSIELYSSDDYVMDQYEDVQDYNYVTYNK